MLFDTLIYYFTENFLDFANRNTLEVFFTLNELYGFVGVLTLKPENLLELVCQSQNFHSPFDTTDFIPSSWSAHQAAIRTRSSQCSPRR